MKEDCGQDGRAKQTRANVLKPTWSKVKEAWVYAGLEVRRRGDGEFGVFALVNLPAGLEIPYLGVVLDKQGELDLQRLAAEDDSGNEKRLTAYVVQVSRRPARFVDAHPRHETAKTRGLSIASRVNEPDEGDQANAFFLSRIASKSRTLHPFLRLCRRVKVGEEITAVYGETWAPRTYRIGTPCCSPEFDLSASTFRAS